MIRTHGTTHYTPDSCYGCRVLTIQFGIPAFTPHYNYAVGHWVTSWQDFNDRMKRKGDEAQTVYEPIHPADLRANPPPETAPSHLPRLSTIDDPNLLKRVEAARADARARALLESETTDLIGDDDGD